jgi:hypothetical protein
VGNAAPGAGWSRTILWEPMMGNTISVLQTTYNKQVIAFERDARERGRLLMLQGEAQVGRVERDRASDVREII